LSALSIPQEPDDKAIDPVYIAMSLAAQLNLLWEALAVSKGTGLSQGELSIVFGLSFVSRGLAIDG
jgi:hypothetical protein